MTLFEKNVNIYDGNAFVRGKLNRPLSLYREGADTIRDPDSIYVFPAFCDVHVHLREPGFIYKETVRSGTLAAAHGGYTDICAMPNLDPVPDSPESLKIETDIISRDAVIRVHPYGALTIGEHGKALARLREIGENVVAFSDDGHGVQSEDIMRRAMQIAADMGKIVAAHCEDESLVCGGCVHDGVYAAQHGLPGIPSESEWRQLERDLRLVRECGCAYHVCHVSCEESVRLIRQAKFEGLDVTCETAPHYLILTEDDLTDDGAYKMNPPLRSTHDRAALLEGIADGTVDMIATDHAPHSAEEKSRGLANSLMGISGLECAFPILYTELVRNGVITLERLIELMSDAPRRRFALPCGDDICVFDLERCYTIDPMKFLSSGKCTPFSGRRVFGENLLTVCGGKTVWSI